MDKDKAEEEAKEYKDKYDELTTAISNVRKEKTNLLKNANLPLDGLSVEDGELTYKGFKWDNMSGAEQMYQRLLSESSIPIVVLYFLISWSKWIPTH